MVYGELGRMPLYLIMHIRTLTFWGRLINGEQTKLSSVMYRLLYRMDMAGTYSSPWLVNVKSILNNAGFSYMWQSQQVNTNTLKNLLKDRLQDQFRQTWAAEVFASPKCLNYRIFKHELKLESYLLQLPNNLRHVFTKFRCRNHKLPIEIGAYQNVERRFRLCTKCNSGKLGDEFHCIFQCNHFSDHRKSYLPRSCLSNASTEKFDWLMNTENCKRQLQLAKFIKIIYNSFH